MRNVACRTHFGFSFRIFSLQFKDALFLVLNKIGHHDGGAWGGRAALLKVNVETKQWVVEQMQFTTKDLEEAPTGDTEMIYAVTMAMSQFFR